MNPRNIENQVDPVSVHVPPFSVSIIMPVMDETVSLRETVGILREEVQSNLHEIICVVSRFSTREAIGVCHELERAWPEVIKVRQQDRPFLGGALQDAFSWATGSYILLMASDLETDPYTAKRLIAEARTGWDIVATTRWKEGGGFRGYNPVKFVLNWLFQKIVGALYGTSLSDLTYGYRIYRAEVLRDLEWSELRHPFLLECLLRPLLRGVTATEIPVRWEPRPEGESHNPFWRNFLYFRIALRLRFRADRLNASQGLSHT
jgi:glycosyltransferase involved in cell wall biosynthesis